MKTAPPLCCLLDMESDIYVMFCSKCGAKIADNARFCPSCGSPNEFLNATQGQSKIEPVSQRITPVKANPVVQTKPAANIGMSKGLAYPLCIISAVFSVFGNIVEYYYDPIPGSICGIIAAILTFLVWLFAVKLLKRNGNVSKQVLVLSIIIPALGILMSIMDIWFVVDYSVGVIPRMVLFYLYLGVLIWWTICLLTSFIGKMRIYAIFNLIFFPIFIISSIIFGIISGIISGIGFSDIEIFISIMYDIADCVLLIMALTETHS